MTFIIYVLVYNKKVKGEEKTVHLRAQNWQDVKYIKAEKWKSWKDRT